jgi:hypothetical protein
MILGAYRTTYVCHIVCGNSSEFSKSICEGGKLKELDKEKSSPLQIAHDNVGV